MSASTERVYGQDGRRRFVASLPCFACGTRTRVRQGHHVETDGMARKSGYMAIVPLCFQCHNDVHREGAKSFARRHNIHWQEAAFRTECLWQWRCMHDERRMEYVHSGGIDDAVCRWATDTFRSDVYVVPSPSEDGWYITHIAPYALANPPEHVADKLPPDLWFERHQDVQRFIRAAGVTPIAHDMAGETFHLSGQDTVTLLGNLLLDGLRVPMLAVQAIREGT